MQIEIQRNADVSLSKQIYQSIVDRIRSGLLHEGLQLPSVRILSKQIGVSLVTAVKAYQQLEQDGFITSVQGKGTFVKVKRKAEEERKDENFSYDWQLSVQDYLPRSQFGRFHLVPEKINLSSSMVDPGLLPNRYLEREIHQMLSENPRILSQYGEIQGDTLLRKEMVEYLKSSGVPSTPENILVTSGSQQGIDLVARTFVGPGDVVVMEAPTYPGAIDVFRGRGATILTVPVDKDGMRVDILQNLCDKHKPKIIYTIPTFHNPTGVVMTLKRRRQILDIAHSIQSLIIEDDPWSEIYFGKKPPAPIKSIDHKGHVIYLKGLSKTLAPGCRIGILSASGSLFNRLLAAKANTDLGSPLLTQKSILPFINSKQMMEHYKKLRTALRIRRDLVLELLSQHMPDSVSWVIPEGGLNLWISLPYWLDSNHVLIEAKKQQLSFLPGSACYPVEQENHHLRVSYSYMNEQLLQQGVTTLCNILHSQITSKTVHDSSPFF
ncbi:PLP-dependent aminotransferase family protein [Bacillus sp. ISL-40]|uniref:MocR-like pyridoxine biosynthesis transcription factor PdxR n=1 Tax=unclassified Bacillus (in: firmicutes) TaxID=185979 RepID=UPI001BE518AA|nr:MULTISPECIES: PLP-dependent aminotransferase family protein [unclassified Bacillus (in: firmicutes)]MBT2699146.1 PLP-dependent aminotransferase family protein [Bacillus sp. ISL-40]MBT2724894.1 PLP-dependent aminotransferase family protein [Bacillus sp. ISL-46]MBT2739400.1 PLP-dependent aminotransferase family protein [Bacillus sp. ISL-77]